jgi:hypothetical protein
MGGGTVADYLDSMGNVVVDRSADELIAAVVAALAVALAMAGVYWIGRRKTSENLMPFIVLMIVANLVSMALGAGYMLHARRTGRHLPHDGFRAFPPRAHHGNDPDAVLVQTFIRAADRNRDGLLTSEEASRAASDLVRQVDTTGKGSIDTRSVDSIVRAALLLEDESRRQHPFPPFGPPPARPPYGSMRRFHPARDHAEPGPGSATEPETSDAAGVSTGPGAADKGALH